MGRSDSENIKLTVSQENVLRQVLDFVDTSRDRVFILKGYAGTGKTTLVRFLIKALLERGKHYRLLASTGRAAKVLANLSDSFGQTSTIHSLIYAFNGLNRDFGEKEEPTVDKDGQLFLVFEPSQLNENETPETVYIIDEASMVSDVATQDITQARFGDGRLLTDLLDYDQRSGSKYIFVGDPCQLPPIEEYYSPALMKDYFKEQFGLTAQEAQLTEIMRQDGVCGIVEASKQIRRLYNHAPENSQIYGSQKLWGFLPFRQYRDIALHPDLETMINDYVAKVNTSGLNSAVCICRSNKACSQLSEVIRQKLGFSGSRIQRGDLLMVIQNNLSTGLMNGDMVTIEEIDVHTTIRAQLSFRQVRVKELFTGKTYTTLLMEETAYQGRLNLDSRQQQALFIDFIIRMREKGITQKQKGAFYNAMMNDPYLNALRCVFGYAITCHKSQGGEWDEVYVHVPRNLTLNPTKETYQWVYTSMTRARKTLHMIDDFYIK
ncbi:MAG: AAA family ATPase [Bacteroidaceae bacterium]|nr:AAA family ATPase [Bacteroidaceae bacterium]